MTAKGAVNKTEMLLRSYHMTRKLYEGYTRPRVKWKRVSRHKFSPRKDTRIAPKGEVQNLSYSANKKQKPQTKCFNVFLEIY